MRFALIEDSIAIKSYYIKDNVAYGYHDNKPYIYHHAFSPECFLAMFNLPFLFEFGCHINWMDWEVLPDMLRLAILFATLHKFEKNLDRINRIARIISNDMVIALQKKLALHNPLNPLKA